MTALAELLDDGSARRLELARQRAEHRQAEALSTPVTAPVCESCGQRLPAPLPVFAGP